MSFENLFFHHKVMVDGKLFPESFWNLRCWKL